MNVFIGTEENILKDEECHTVPMEVHLMSRPHAGVDKEPVPRKEILAHNKLLAEGRPVERATVLGWDLDARRLELCLQDDNFPVSEENG